MAIKGKGKTRSRPAARAPRPAPVVRKPPFFARPWVRFAAGLLLGVGLAMLVVWATNGLRRDDADEARAAAETNARTVVQRWQATVDAAISKIGSSGPGGGPATIFPTLSDSVAALADGDTDKTAEDTATMAIGLSDEVATTLGGVDLVALIRGKGVDLATTNYLLNSQARMIDGIELYGRVAKLVKAAMTAGDPAATEASIAEAKALLPIATRVFGDGYSDYTESLAQAGLLQPTPGLSGLSGSPSG